MTHNVLFDLRGCADSTCADALILMFVTLFLAASPQLRLPRLQGAEASGIPADPCKPTSPTQTAQPTHGLSLQAFRLSAYWSTSGVTLLLGTAHVFVFLRIVFCVSVSMSGVQVSVRTVVQVSVRASINVSLGMAVQASVDIVTRLPYRVG